MLYAEPRGWLVTSHGVRRVQWVTNVGLQVDEEGNVNVSYFPPRTPGCGGFIDISQTAKKVIFVGSFTSGGLKVTTEQPKELASFLWARLLLRIRTCCSGL